GEKEKHDPFHRLAITSDRSRDIVPGHDEWAGSPPAPPRPAPTVLPSRASAHLDQGVVDLDVGPDEAPAAHHDVLGAPGPGPEGSAHRPPPATPRRRPPLPQHRPAARRHTPASADSGRDEAHAPAAVLGGSFVERTRKTENQSQTWWTDLPGFAACFHNTVAILNFALLVLCFSTISYLLWKANQGVSPAPELIISPTIQLVTMVLVVFLTQMERMKGVQSSGVLMVFWLLSLLSSSGFQEQPFQHLSSYIYFALVLSELVLCCFTDPPPFFSKISNGSNPCPESGASFVSKITFWWFARLIWKGYWTPLQPDVLWSLAKENSSEEIMDKRENADEAAILLQPEASKSKELLKTFWTVFGTYFLLATLCLVTCDVFLFLVPKTLSLFLDFINDQEAALWIGYFYAAAIFLLACLQTLFEQRYMYMCCMLGMRLKTAVTSLVYRKLLGPSALSAVIIFLVLLPLNFGISKKRSQLQETQIKYKDGRARLTSTILSDMKVLKLHGWEKKFISKVLGIRSQELQALKMSQFLFSASLASFQSSTFLISFIIFAVYTLSDKTNVLDAKKAFVSLSLVNILNTAHSFLPFSINAVVQIKLRWTLSLRTVGTTAFVPQMSWIQNASVEDNVVFGRKMERTWYNQVVKACALQPDIDGFPAGSRTEIGEKKQRLSLARAVYMKASVYLLDDPLSAVDAPTRILVTNTIHILPKVDNIIVMVNGEISEMGSWQELIQKQGAFADFLRSQNPEEKEDQDLQITAGHPKDNYKPTQEEGRRLMAEDKKQKSGWQVFSFCRGYWLTLWANDPVSNGTQPHTQLRVGVFFLLGVTQAIGKFGSVAAVFLAGIMASHKLFQQLLLDVLRSPITFFEQTPSGNLLNRFSKEMDAIDSIIPDKLKSLLGFLFNLLEIYVVIVVATPMVLVAVLPLSALYVAFQVFFVTTSCQLKRLEAASRSPIYSNISETFEGSSLIRAFRVQQRFIVQNDVNVDENHKVSFPSVVADRYKDFSVAGRKEAPCSEAVYLKTLVLKTELFRPLMNPFIPSLRKRGSFQDDRHDFLQMLCCSLNVFLDLREINSHVRTTLAFLQMLCQQLLLCAGFSTPTVPVGSRFSYSYSTSTTTFLQGRAYQRSGITLESKVVIEVLANCHQILKLQGVQIKTIFESEQYPLWFCFHNGKVLKIFPQKNESTWALNIKRAVLSALQTSSLGAAPNNSVEEMKDFNLCSHHFSGFTSLRSVALPNASRFEEKGILAEIKCMASHLVTPPSRKGSGVKMQTRTDLKLFRTEAHSVSQEKVPTSDIYESSLLYEKEKMAPPSKEEEMKEVANVLQKLCVKPSMDTEPTDLFLNLVFALRQISADVLMDLWQSPSSKCQDNWRPLLDALPFCASEPCIILMKKLIILQEVEEDHIDHFLTSLTFIPEPTAGMIDALAPLLELPKERQIVFLALTSLLHHFCSTRTNCDQVPAVLRIMKILGRRLGRKCTGSRLEGIAQIYLWDVSLNFTWASQMELILNAIGNAGLAATSLTTLLSSCAVLKTNPIEIRLAAIEAFRRIPCAANRAVLVQLFQTYDENVEIRIASYLMVMKCPSKDLFNHIKWTLQEERSSQVVSFVWSHLSELLRTEDPLKQHLRNSLPEDILLKEFDWEMWKFSSYTDVTFHSAIAGGNAEAQVIFSPASFIPRLIQTNFTLHLLGRAINLFQANTKEKHVKPESPMEMVNKIPQNKPSSKQFNLKSHLPKGNKTMLRTESDCPRGQYHKVHDFVKKFTQKMGKKKKPKCKVNLKIFGNELMILDCGDFRNQAKHYYLNLAELTMKVLKGQEVQWNKRLSLATEEVLFPTISGFPALLGFNASIAVNLTARGDTNFKKHNHFFINGYLKPSIILQISAQMGTIGVLGNAGLKWSTILRSSANLDGGIQVKKGKEFTFFWNTPEDAMEILHFSSKLYITAREKTKTIDGFPDHTELCTSEEASKTFGWQLCSVFLPNDKTSSFLLPFPGPKGSWIPNEARLHFFMGSPESELKRNVAFDFHWNIPQRKIRIEFIEPKAKMLLNGQIEISKYSRVGHLELIVNDNTIYYIKGRTDLQSVAGEQSFAIRLEAKLLRHGSPVVLAGNLTRLASQKVAFSVSLINLLKDAASFAGTIRWKEKPTFPAFLDLTSFSFCKNEDKSEGDAKKFHHECNMAQKLKVENSWPDVYRLDLEHKFHLPEKNLDYRTRLQHSSSFHPSLESSTSFKVHYNNRILFIADLQWKNFQHSAFFTTVELTVGKAFVVKGLILELYCKGHDAEKEGRIELRTSTTTYLKVSSFLLAALASTINRFMEGFLHSQNEIMSLWSQLIKHEVLLENNQHTKFLHFRLTSAKKEFNLTASYCHLEAPRKSNISTSVVWTDHKNPPLVLRFEAQLEEVKKEKMLYQKRGTLHFRHPLSLPIPQSLLLQETFTVNKKEKHYSLETRLVIDEWEDSILALTLGYPTKNPYICARLTHPYNSGIFPQNTEMCIMVRNLTQANQELEVKLKISQEEVLSFLGKYHNKSSMGQSHHLIQLDFTPSFQLLLTPFKTVIQQFNIWLNGPGSGFELYPQFLQQNWSHFPQTIQAQASLNCHGQNGHNGSFDLHTSTRNLMFLEANFDNELKRNTRAFRVSAALKQDILDQFKYVELQFLSKETPSRLLLTSSVKLNQHSFQVGILGSKEQKAGMVTLRVHVQHNLESIRLIVPPDLSLNSSLKHRINFNEGLVTVVVNRSIFSIHVRSKCLCGNESFYSVMVAVAQDGGEIFLAQGRLKGSLEPKRRIQRDEGHALKDARSPCVDLANIFLHSKVGFTGTLTHNISNFYAIGLPTKSSLKTMYGHNDTYQGVTVNLQGGNQKISVLFGVEKLHPEALQTQLANHSLAVQDFHLGNDSMDGGEIFSNRSFAQLGIHTTCNLEYVLETSFSHAWPYLTSLGLAQENRVKMAVTRGDPHRVLLEITLGNGQWTGHGELSDEAGGTAAEWRVTFLNKPGTLENPALFQNFVSGGSFFSKTHQANLTMFFQWNGTAADMQLEIDKHVVRGTLDHSLPYLQELGLPHRTLILLIMTGNAGMEGLLVLHVDSCKLEIQGETQPKAKMEWTLEMEMACKALQDRGFPNHAQLNGSLLKDGGQLEFFNSLQVEDQGAAFTVSTKCQPTFILEMELRHGLSFLNRIPKENKLIVHCGKRLERAINLEVKSGLCQLQANLEVEAGNRCQWQADLGIPTKMNGSGHVLKDKIKLDSQVVLAVGENTVSAFLLLKGTAVRAINSGIPARTEVDLISEKSRTLCERLLQFKVDGQQVLASSSLKHKRASVAYSATVAQPFNFAMKHVEFSSLTQSRRGTHAQQEKYLFWVLDAVCLEPRPASLDELHFWRQVQSEQHMLGCLYHSFFWTGMVLFSWNSWKVEEELLRNRIPSCQKESVQFFSGATAVLRLKNILTIASLRACGSLKQTAAMLNQHLDLTWDNKTVVQHLTYEIWGVSAYHGTCGFQLANTRKGTFTQDTGNLIAGLFLLCEIKIGLQCFQKCARRDYLST
ncbi:hypothetical protein E2320_012116, partial [Naja naja]